MRGRGFIVATATERSTPTPSEPPLNAWEPTMSEIEGGSHAIALSQPDKVTAVVLEALRSIS